MLKGNQRYNGTSGYTNGDNEAEFGSSNGIKLFYNTQSTLPSGKQSNVSSSNIARNNESSIKPSLFQIIKEEIVDNVEQNRTHSIIGISNKVHNVNKSKSASHNRSKRNNSRNSYHESLQRIGGGDVCYNQYQQHWFSNSLELMKLEDKSREERLEITRYELQRHLNQITRSNLGGRGFETETTWLNSNLSSNPNMPQSPKHNLNANYDKLVAVRNCDTQLCKCRALPCTRFCELHIMKDLDQSLYSYCTAKFADNTQCTVPVCDTVHELPLCKEHALKRDNYRLFQETKPKKFRKKVKLSAMIRPQKRYKKKKRPLKPPDITNGKIGKMSRSCNVASDMHGDVEEEVLSLHEPDGLELVSVEHALVTQASHLLEESEINTVLSTIHGDEFSDFFSVNRNGEYEPTREEAEELERALEAVDNDVKSLEQLSQSHGLLDTFLDENTLVESLVQIPDVFHNGYAQCGENIVSHTSRLLSVESHSHS